MKICILYSGGLDSLIMKRFSEVYYQGAEVECIWYDIGQSYNYKEKAVLPAYVQQRRLDWKTTEDQSLEHSKTNTLSGSIFIPGRNAVMAVAAACSTLADEIWLGALLGETHESSTDKNAEFLVRCNHLLNYVLKPFIDETKVRFPLVDFGLNKLTSVKWGLEHGLSPEVIINSSSCLSGEQGKCGRCVVCFRRYGIFKQLGLEETYNVDPLTAEENKAVVREMLLENSHYDHHRKSEILPSLTPEYISSL